MNEKAILTQRYCWVDINRGASALSLITFKKKGILFDKLFGHYILGKFVFQHCINSICQINKTGKLY